MQTPEPTTKRYQLTDRETEMWRRQDAQGAEEREFLVSTYIAGEKAGTTIAIHDAWGAELVKFTI